MATGSLYLFRPLLWSTLVIGVLFCQNFGLAEESTPKADAQTQKIGKFLALTVATEANGGFKRFQRSTLINSIPLKVLGMGEKWEGGDIEKFPGGGHKVNLLKPELEKYKDDPEMIILFTDAYDVVMVAGVDRILEEFKKFDARVVFSAEGFCWPDADLASQYPPVERGKRYLNSGAFIGYAPDLYKIVTSSPIGDKDDDQLFYTKVFLDEKLRSEYSMKLDHRSSIFQNLYGASGDVDVKFKGKEAYVQNTAFNTVPLILHGNGRSKLHLNTLANYVPNGWNSEDGCVSCWENMNSLEKREEKDFPTVLFGIFIEQPTPFLEEFFNRTLGLTYPKQKIDLFIHNSASYHAKLVDAFIEKEGSAYRSVKLIRDTDNIKEWHARNLGIDECIKKKCDYYFNLDAVAHIDNPHTLKLLIEQNRPMVAPMMIRPYKAWSNFWGALTNDGFYARSLDYMEIVQNTRRGLWNVPYVTSAYLIQGSIIHDAKTKPSYINNLLDADMALCTNMRGKGIDMYVTNRLDWGHLINAESFDTTHVNNEMYEIFNNRWDWEQRYIHENYSQGLDESLNVTQPCPDVYWFPIFKPRFCVELIAEMENFGQWSDGTSQDPRLDGGYENVPTRDIHMKQVGFEQHWLQFLRDYVRPLQERVFKGYFHDDPRIEGGYESVPTRDIHMKQIGFEEGWLYFLQTYVQPLQQRVFEGYFNDPPRAIMNFVVRYRPDEQPFLRPHHDSSTYTINVALNRGGIDYQGGGCRFLRYNCSVTDTKMGWMLMHPGRLTHYHEGLYVTEGTRYIMVSFVDP